MRHSGTELLLMNDRIPPDGLLLSSDQIENETELIPLITAEDEEQMNAEQTPPELPILPLRNTVLFPGVVIPITVGRDRSIRLIQEVYRGNKTLGVASQKDSTIEDPRPERARYCATAGWAARAESAPRSFAPRPRL